ncbi:MAG: pyrroline-5-carboxylate reductase, partial [Gammaproteobacteria bacterium]|nr:pyrroline-5-carboxylate reductase [Gammaproteobacteria bacterium]NIR93342.1 pyrroline-5-carboxylate reductase [Gammaproteobacteria bacterium]NIW43602.1 pyrroline-5-carboxylate reductase [Gammaproteobacteria bacterium]
MPNTPALVNAGASGLCRNSHVTEKQHDTAETIMRSVGITTWIEDEKLLDVVTAISGSGPAYFFYFMEIMQNTAQELGLSQ